MDEKLYLVHISVRDFIVNLIEYNIVKETEKRFYVEDENVLAGTRKPYASFFDKDHDLVFKDFGEAVLHFQDEIIQARKRLGNREAELYAAQEKVKSLC